MLYIRVIQTNNENVMRFIQLYCHCNAIHHSRQKELIPECDLTGRRSTITILTVRSHSGNHTGRKVQCIVWSNQGLIIFPSDLCDVISTLFYLYPQTCVHSEDFVVVEIKVVLTRLCTHSF